MLRLASCVCALTLMVTGIAPANAHKISRSECVEGGEFIRNAALSRDAGMSRDSFITKMAEDLALIQSFPPALRWFVQDASDEELLTGAVVRVFDEPVMPEQHEERFISECMQTTADFDDKEI
jgi:hypothetical protein